MEQVVKVFKYIQYSLHKHDISGFCLKVKQVQCFESLVTGHDVVCVLSTGYGKSLLFHLLPQLLPVKSTNNIVIVVCPLISIIEDQVKKLQSRNISVAVLHAGDGLSFEISKLFIKSNMPN